MAKVRAIARVRPGQCLGLGQWLARVRAMAKVRARAVARVWTGQCLGLGQWLARVRAMAKVRAMARVRPGQYLGLGQ